MDPHYDQVGKFFTTLDGVPVRKLFVSKLPEELSSAAIQTLLLNLFKHYGDLNDICVVERNEGKPFAFVTFRTPQDAAKALSKKDQIVVAGKKLYLSPADSWHQPMELMNGDIIWDRRKQDILRQDETLGNNVFGNSDQGGNSNDREVITNHAPNETTEDEEEEEHESEEDSCPIDKLNDDCLRIIFELIPVPNRLTLGHVCRRWRELNSYYWKSLKKLDFTTYPLGDVTLTDGKLNYFLQLCPNVTSLNIAQDENDLTSEAIVIIAKSCKGLEEIHMRNITIQRRSLAYLANSCPQLKSFSLDACSSHHDGEMISLVKKSKNLESISLKYGSKTFGMWLKNLQSPLQRLVLEMYEFNPDYLLVGIDKVKSTLKELSFVSCSRLRNCDLLEIVHMCPNLTKFSLSGILSFFESKAILPITQLSKLESLDLEHNRVVCDNFMMSLVEGCPHLKYLNLSGIESYDLTERGLSLLVKLTKLTHLRMACLKVTDNLLKILSKKLNLKHLDIMGCQSITDEGCIEILSNCHNLESLDLAGCMLISNETILAAVNILSNDPNRKKLNIVCGNTLVKEESWFHENDMMKRLNVDLKSTIIANFFDDIYQMDSDLDSDNSYEDYESDGNLDICDLIMNDYELYIEEDDGDYI